MDEDEPLFEHGDGGVQVFRIDAEDGLSPAALIEHETLIHRTVLVGDHLFAISPGTVTAHALDDLATTAAELQLDGDAEFTPLVAYVAPARYSIPSPRPAFAALVETSPVVELVKERIEETAQESVEVRVKELVEEPGVNAADLGELYAVPKSFSPADQLRSGRDAAIAQLARARVFGSFVAPRPSLTATTIATIDRAFDGAPDAVGDDADDESTANFYDRAFGANLVPQLD